MTDPQAAGGRLTAEELQRTQLEALGLLPEFEPWVGCDLADHLGEALTVARGEVEALKAERERLLDMAGSASERQYELEARAEAAEQAVVALRSQLEQAMSMFASLKDDADRIAGDNSNTAVIPVLWRGKSIAYEVVLGRLRALLAAPPRQEP